MTLLNLNYYKHLKAIIMKTMNSFFYFMLFSFVLANFISCKTNEPNDPGSDSAGTVTDKDGNEYHTVKIGTQVWMVENLKTTKYNDGSTIPIITDNTAWTNLSTGAYCNYDNDVSTANKYGKLYNWYAVNTGKLAPTGWHVPTDAEWSTLEDYASMGGNTGVAFGGSGGLGKALASKTDWTTTYYSGAIGNDLSKNNSSGFSALPGGYRSDDGTFYDVGDRGRWWNTDFDPSYSRYKEMEYLVGFVSDRYTRKEVGFSVRCIKDYTSNLPLTKVDTVIIKVNFDLPSDVILSQIYGGVLSSVLKDGFVGQMSSSNIRSLTFIFVSDQATLLIGKSVTFGSNLQGRYQGLVGYFTCTNPDISLILKKGLNEVTLHFHIEKMTY